MLLDRRVIPSSGVFVVSAFLAVFVLFSGSVCSFNTGVSHRYRYGLTQHNRLRQDAFKTYWKWAPAALGVSQGPSDEPPRARGHGRPRSPNRGGGGAAAHRAGGGGAARGGAGGRKGGAGRGRSGGGGGGRNAAGGNNGGAMPRGRAGGAPFGRGPAAAVQGGGGGLRRRLAGLPNQTVLDRLRGARSLDFKKEALEVLFNSPEPLTSAQLPSVLKACGEIGDYKKLSYFFEQMEDKKIWNVYGYTSFMKACGRMGRYLEALGTFRRMQYEGIQVDNTVYHCIICILKDAGQWEAAVDLAEEMAAEGRCDAAALNQAAAAAVAAGEWPLAMELFENAQGRFGVVPDVFLYTTAISACTDLGDVGRALHLLGRLRAAGLRPNEYTYTALIATCEKAGDAARAGELIREAEAAGAANVRTYSAACRALAEAGDLEGAVDLLGRMRERGVPPNAYTYSALILACGGGGGGGGGWRRALAVLGGMRDDGVRPNAVCYASAMRVCREAGRAREVFALLEEMKARGLVLSAVPHHLALGACARPVPRAGKALALLEEMKAAADPARRPTLYSYNSVIAAVGNNHLLALRLLEELRGRGLRPDAYSYSLAIAACLRARATTRAQALVAEMREAGVAPDAGCVIVCLNACLQGPGEGWRAAFAYLEELQESQDVELTVVSYNILLSACNKGGMPERALKLYEEMLDEDVEPDVVTFTTLIQIFSSDWEKAQGFLEDMKQRGVAPNVVTYGAALAAARHAGRGRGHPPGAGAGAGAAAAAARELWGEMRAAGVRPNVITYGAMIEALESSGGEESTIDSIYAGGIEQKVFSHWKIKEDDLNKVLELHDFTIAMSKAALRQALDELLAENFRADKDLVIITGSGNHSEGGFSIIKPALQAYLKDNFSPPLHALEMSSNPGRLIIPKENIQSWLIRQTTRIKTKQITI